ncbi:hypothetical protein ACFO9E_25710 [Streptomyces maoxianensis]|uniref:Helix-turn-helix DNA binding domain protein n=1 Tax=Streptomyces maoxianensis TaxID=1459942 RepID=A0ABV9GB27_9ACTN
MGVRLIVEILDHWQDVGLTPGERGDLIVLAENANDKSRETWGPVHADHILKRAAKTPASWRISINRLMKKKALEFARRDGKEVRGYTGQHAVYRLVELCPEPPHSGYKGHCTKPEKGVDSTDTPGGEEGYPSDNPVGEDQEEGYLTANPEGYLTANAVDGEGYLTATERVSGQLTPTPLVSSFDLSSKDSPSSSVAEASSDVLEGVVIEGGGGGSDQFIKRSDDFVAALDYRGKQPGRTRRDKLTLLVAGAFKAGWNEQTLRDYLDLGGAPVNSAAAVYEHRLHKDELPDAPAPIAGRQAPPPACSSCLEENPGAEFNMRLRQRDGHICDCHPGSDAYQARQRDMDGFAAADGGMWVRAMGRAQARMASGGDWSGAGTDERVGGWMALSASLEERDAALNGPTFKPSISDQRVQQALGVGRSLQAEHDAKNAPGGYKPYSNSGWDEMEQQVANGTRPDRADGVPHCGDPDCDEYSRTRETEDANGLRSTSACGKCHPRLRF